LKLWNDSVLHCQIHPFHWGCYSHFCWSPAYQTAMWTHNAWRVEGASAKPNAPIWTWEVYHRFILIKYGDSNSSAKKARRWLT
jgi:hypothetical protein